MKRSECSGDRLGHPVPADEGDAPTLLHARIWAAAPEAEMVLRWIGRSSKARMVKEHHVGQVQRAEP